ncbi:histidinol-phosphatase [Helicobacter sp. 13S00477-4]|uniref:histidinol-phosphatase n=1 Tax=Helicobacter sp. 13S00477-4 TaxID=1905759 RepID=UPI000BA631B3|nr:histidinol-phosphatase [Helicobacter sp. 13S00477-4]PAF50669.1 histidinol phosphate phosphatase [Helicobacter sp. 13S00477-4]
MRVDLHNHTTLCNHASGSIDEYISKAVELGINIYGFSCHAPMDFDSKYRMTFEELDEYHKMIIEAKKKYENQIEILMGLEVDFIKGREYLLDKKVLQYPCDYLIGSIHFIDEWGFDNPEFIGEYAKKDIDEYWKKYLQSIQKMAESRFFQIVGHFDLLKIFGYKPTESIFPYIKETLQVIRETEMVIEINAAGFRKPIKEQYPDFKILEYAKKIGIPITFGSDAHSIDQVGFGYEKCLQIAKKIGYKKAIYFKNKNPYSFSL